MAVPGDADRPGQALVPGPERGLQRAARAGDPVELVQVADGVQLEQVDVVGLQPLEAAVDLRPGGLRVADAGLGGQEDPVADPGIHGPSRSSASP